MVTPATPAKPLDDEVVEDSQVYVKLPEPPDGDVPVIAAPAAQALEVERVLFETAVAIVIKTDFEKNVLLHEPPVVVIFNLYLVFVVKLPGE